MKKHANKQEGQREFLEKNKLLLTDRNGKQRIETDAIHYLSRGVVTRTVRRAVQ